MARRIPLDPVDINEAFPDGIATRTELIRLGVADSTITRACTPSGPWRRLFPGVVLLGDGAPSRRQLVLAALRYIGPPALVTGLEAVRRYGVRQLLDDGRVHLLVPHNRHVNGRGPVVVERTRRMPKTRFSDGVPLAPPARALVDAARRAKEGEPVRAMFEDAVRRGACHVEDLAEELSVSGPHGRVLARQALGEVAAGVWHARLAPIMRELVRRCGLPPPRWYVEVRATNGRELGVIDAWWEDVGLAWDVGSMDYARSKVERASNSPDIGALGGWFRAAARRHERLSRAGVEVVHTVPSQLRRDPDLVCCELVRAYQWARVKRRPRVVVQRWRPAPQRQAA